MPQKVERPTVWVPEGTTKNADLEFDNNIQCAVFEELYHIFDDTENDAFIDDDRNVLTIELDALAVILTANKDTVLKALRTRLKPV